jgi:hypothetical protein
MALPSLVSALSPSSRRALGFALAAARQREPDSAVEPDDLLVGLLLAHPDEAGEARVLLAHFGLTGRDVLAPDYPRGARGSRRGWTSCAGSASTASRRCSPTTRRARAGRAAWT